MHLEQDRINRVVSSSKQRKKNENEMEVFSLEASNNPSVDWEARGRRQRWSWRAGEWSKMANFGLRC